MSSPQPLVPPGRPETFRSTVHGTVFADRDRNLRFLKPGEVVRLIPDPPGQDDPAVWVHLASGEPIGHLPPEIASWLAPWLLGGGQALATAVKVAGEDVPSWRRLVLEVTCLR